MRKTVGHTDIARGSYTPLDLTSQTPGWLFEYATRRMLALFVPACLRRRVWLGRDGEIRSHPNIKSFISDSPMGPRFVKSPGCLIGRMRIAASKLVVFLRSMFAGMT